VKNRVTKLQSYKVSGALRLGAIYATGPIAAIAYGAEVNAIPPAKLKSMRVQKLKLMGKYTQGVPVEQQYLLLPPSDDTVLTIQMAPLLRYHKEVWAAGDPPIRNQGHTHSPRTTAGIRVSQRRAQWIQRTSRSNRHGRSSSQPRRVDVHTPVCTTGQSQPSHRIMARVTKPTTTSVCGSTQSLAPRATTGPHTQQMGRSPRVQRNA